LVDDVDVESIGEPGHRSFRLVIERRAATASLWIEKEQLEYLALIVDQQLARFGRRPSQGALPLLTLVARFPSKPTVDLHVSRMAISFDSDRDRFVFAVHSLDQEEEGDRPALRWSANQAQAQALSEKIRTVAAAGRPRCPLCGSPIEGTHRCPLSDGRVP
jgi:uncharacterized repeat protein (TIGR03847 family)